MTYSMDSSEKGAEIELSRILNREIFLYFLDLEVKQTGDIRIFLVF